VARRRIVLLPEIRYSYVEWIYARELYVPRVFPPWPLAKLIGEL
jgi:hypothetical protein